MARTNKQKKVHQRRQRTPKKGKTVKKVKTAKRAQTAKTCLDSLKTSDVLLLKIYAEWCIHCQNMKTEWEKFAETIKPNTIIKELEESKDSNEISSVLRRLKYKESLGFPTIILVCRKGKKLIYKRYEGERTATEFNNFILDYMKNR